MTNIFFFAQKWLNAPPGGAFKLKSTPPQTLFSRSYEGKTKVYKNVNVMSKAPFPVERHKFVFSGKRDASK